MRKSVKSIRWFMIFLVCTMTGCNNMAQLKKPDKIQIVSGENITEYSKDTGEYASIFKVIKGAWDETTVRMNKPTRILLQYINPDSVEKITIEVRWMIYLSV